MNMSRQFFCGTILACVAVLLPLATAAQTPIGPLRGRGIAGTVKFKGGLPAERITVKLFTSDLRPINSMITDSLGAFQFSPLNPGVYVVVIDEASYHRVEESVDVYPAGRGPDVVRRSYILEPRPGAEPPVAPGAVSVQHLKLPKEARDAFDKGQKELNKRNYPAAIENLDRAIATAPDFADALYARGLIALQQNQPAQAKEFFKKAVAANPQNGDSYIGLGTALLRDGDAQGAMEPLTKGIELSPKSYLGQFERCRAHLALGKLAEAEADCQRARNLAAAPQPGLLILTGNLYLKQNRPPEALREFEEYLKLDFSSATAASVRALVKQMRDSGVKPK